MKKLPIEEDHIALGAKMHPFAGYNMPIQYSGLMAEHQAVRNQVGIFDVSHMGEIWVEGEYAIPYLQKITTNNISDLVDGKVQYTCFPNGNGGIIDDLVVYRFSDTKYLLVVNGSNIEKDYNWMVKHNSFNVSLKNVSNNTAEFALQGPDSLKVLKTLVAADIENMSSYQFITSDIDGLKNILISTTGYTGEKGFELYCKNEQAKQLWKILMEAGKDFGITPIGLGARDTLRLEKGYCLYGNDIDDTTSPIEAGLGWITKFVDGKDFIDKDVLFNQKQNGLTRRLVGFEMIEKSIPRHDCIIINGEGEKIGKVTSGTMSPSLRKGIGMGYVEINYAKPGTDIFIEIRNKKVKATVVKKPFYKGVNISS